MSQDTTKTECPIAYHAFFVKEFASGITVHLEAGVYKEGTNTLDHIELQKRVHPQRVLRKDEVPAVIVEAAAMLADAFRTPLERLSNALAAAGHTDLAVAAGAGKYGDINMEVGAMTEGTRALVAELVTRTDAAAARGDQEARGDREALIALLKRIRSGEFDQRLPAEKKKG